MTSDKVPGITSATSEYQFFPVTSGEVELLLEGDNKTGWQVVVGSLGPGAGTWPVHLQWEIGSEVPGDRPASRCTKPVQTGVASTSQWQRVPPKPSLPPPLPGDCHDKRLRPGAHSVDESKLADRGISRTFQFPTWNHHSGPAGGSWGGTTIEAITGWQNGQVTVSVDRHDVATGVSSTDLERVADTLAGLALPLVNAWLGPIADVDGDGRLAVLVTSAVDDLPRGTVPLRAFVRGTDLEGHAANSRGQPIDVIYLNARHLTAEGLTSILVHEAAHLAVFSRRREAGLPIRNEEWIDEGLAHAVEWLGTGDGSNLESRWQAFDASPSSAPLEVTHRAGEAGWRGEASRGATARFFSFVLAREGVQELPRLAQLPVAGRTGLTRGLNSAFEDLFREWIVCEWQDRSKSTGIPAVNHFSGEPQGLVLSGSRTADEVPDVAKICPFPAGQRDWQLAGTTAMGCPLGVVPRDSWCRVRVVAPPEARLQVALVRTPGRSRSADAVTTRGTDRLRCNPGHP